MGVLAVGPWVWAPLDNGFCWAPPKGAVGALDLRTADQCAQRVTVQGKGLFYFSGAVPVGYNTIGDYEDTLGLAARRAIENRLGLAQDSIQSTRVGDILFELLTDHRDTTGQTRWRGLMPDHRRNLELWIAGTKIRGENFDILSPRWAQIRDQLRVGRRAWEADVQAGRLTQTQLRKCLGYLVQQYKCDITDLFAQGETVINPLPPETTLPPSPPETFTYADGSLNARNANWTEVDGAFNIVSNACRTNGSLGSTKRCARYEADLSGANHYAQVDVDDQGDVFGMGGGAVRFSSSAQDFYIMVTRNVGDAYRFYKCSGGTLSQISSQASGTTTNPYTNKTEANGSTITLYRNSTNVYSNTDTTFSSNLRTGIGGHSDSDVKYDNWQAADLGGAAAVQSFLPLLGVGD